MCRLSIAQGGIVDGQLLRQVDAETAPRESIHRESRQHAVLENASAKPDLVDVVFVAQSARLLDNDLPELVRSSGIPVMVGGLTSVYCCDAITRAGAEALGRDIGHGLQRMAELLS